MKKELTEETFYEELKNYGIKVLKSEDDIYFQSRLLKSGAFDCYYSRFGHSLHFISRDYRVTISDENIYINDNARAYGDPKRTLCFFTHSPYSQSFSLYTVMFDFFSSIKNKKNEQKLIFKYPTFSNSSGITVSGQENTLKVSHTAVNLTSLKFEKDNIIATFKGTSYSKMILDYEYNIKEIQLSKNLVKTLNIESENRYYNIKDYDDLTKKIKLSLGEKLDLYSLTHDSNYKFKDIENKFNRDLSYLKILTEKRSEFFLMQNNQIEKINYISNYFKNFLSPIIFNTYLDSNSTLSKKLINSYSKAQIDLIKNYDNPFLEKYFINDKRDHFEITSQKNYYKILSFLDYNKKNNIKLFNLENILLYKEIQDELKDFMSFNNEELKITKKSKLTI